jgi:hypothetical protein
MGLGKVSYGERRAAGLCVQCGKGAGGKSKCKGCAAKDKECRQARVTKRKEAGQCQNSGCPKKAMPGKTVCKPCSKKASAATLSRYYANKEAGVCRYCGEDSGGESRCEYCKEAFAAYSQKWYEARKTAGMCVNCANPATGTTVLCEECRAKKNEIARARWLRLKLDAFNAYGGPECFGCGETSAEVLEIDHIAGGGTRHRKTIGLSNIYLWLKQQGYPPGYRVLCPTCNKKAHLGLLKPRRKKGSAS